MDGGRCGMAKRFMQPGIDTLTSNCTGFLKQQHNRHPGNLEQGWAVNDPTAGPLPGN